MTIKLHEAHFEVLTVTHPGMTLEELFVLKHAGTNLERTPHPGNWGLVELALTTNLRPEILTVDTVQGDDEYSAPAHIRVGGESVRIVPRSQSRLRVVGSLMSDHDRINVLAEQYPYLPNPVDESTMVGYHEKGLQLLGMSGCPGNAGISEVLLADEQRRDALRHTLSMLGVLRRYVDSDGRIQPVKDSDDIDSMGLYGSPTNTHEKRLLIPLAGFLGGLLIRAAQEEFGSVYHLAGGSMKHYTRDPELMRLVEAIYIRCAEAILGKAKKITLNIVDITRINKLVDPDLAPLIHSQYDLLAHGLTRVPLVESRVVEPVYRTDK